jgi:hypothetical protein
MSNYGYYISGIGAYLIKVGVPEFEDKDTLLSIDICDLPCCLQEAPREELTI